MIETNHSASCDKCMDDGEQAESWPVHSQDELGSYATVGQFRDRLKEMGWMRVWEDRKWKDICPTCAQRRKAILSARK